MGFPGGSAVKELIYQCRRVKSCGFEPWIGKIPEEEMVHCSNILPWKIHGEMSHGVAESDMTECIRTHMWVGPSTEIQTDMWDSPGGPVVKNPPASAGDWGPIPGLGRLHMSWGN